jgi:hypothetical protein
MIYTMIPYGFYHSTARYEKSLQDDANKLFEEFLYENVNNFYNSNNNSYHMKNGNVGYWMRPLVILRRFSDTEMSWTIITHFYNSDDYDKGIRYVSSGGSIRATLTLALDGPNSLANKDSYTSGLFFIIKDLNRESKYVVNKIFEKSIVYFYDDNLHVIITEPFESRFKEISRAFQGFPSNSEGSFSQMLYLSAVTITKLGYGDIVPISNISRMILSLESLLGIVLIGLFLN